MKRIFLKLEALTSRGSQGSLYGCHATRWLINVMWPSRCCRSHHIRQWSCVTLGVCLSDCLLELYVKTTDRIFMKILQEMHPWTRKNW